MGVLSTVQKPETLYRGMVITINEFAKKEFFGRTIKLPYEPLIDSQGRKTVLDGNEYGVYMTDNERMTEEAYANSNKNGKAEFVSQKITLGTPAQRLMFPRIGILYEIDTKGLDVHQPWISDVLQGHYNNGYEGNEWIAESIPVSNYKTKKIIISEDYLHDSKSVEPTNLETDTNKIITDVRRRTTRLRDFVLEMSKLAPFERSTIDSRDDKKMMRMIYGENGVKYTKANEMETDTPEKMIRYMMANVYKSTGKEKINLKALRYVYSIQKSLDLAVKKGEDFSIQQKIFGDMNKRKSIIERTSASGEKNIESDSTYKLYKNLLNLVQAQDQGDSAPAQGDRKSNQDIDPLVDNGVNATCAAKTKKEEVETAFATMKQRTMEKQKAQSQEHANGKQLE